MSEFAFIQLITDSRGITQITLNRPEVHNALNPTLIKELTEVINTTSTSNSTRAIILTGNGRSFCAGADINHMSASRNFTYEENYEDASKLEELLYLMITSPKPIIGRINGSTIGGAIGIVAACDIALTVERAKFAFSEVNLGIMPAMISPYVIAKIGFSHANHLFVTGERFTAIKAKEIGLVHTVTPNQDELDLAVNGVLDNLLTSSPNAIKEIKQLIMQNRLLEFQALRKYCIEAIAKIRVSDEGKEGLSAFLEKRSPFWSPKNT